MCMYNNLLTVRAVQWLMFSNYFCSKVSTIVLKHGLKNVAGYFIDRMASAAGQNLQKKNIYKPPIYITVTRSCTTK